MRGQKKVHPAPCVSNTTVCNHLREEIADTLPKSPDDLIFTAVYRVQRYRQLRWWEQWEAHPRIARCRVGRYAHAEKNSLRNGLSRFQPMSCIPVSDLSETLQTMSLDESISNCVLPNTHGTPHGASPDTSAHSSQNKRQRLGYHGMESKIGICRVLGGTTSSVLLRCADRSSVWAATTMAGKTGQQLMWRKGGASAKIKQSMQNLHMARRRASNCPATLITSRSGLHSPWPMLQF